MAWSGIQDYRDSCKRINTRVNPAVENAIAYRIGMASTGDRCAWCEVGECISGNTVPIDWEYVDDLNFNESSHNK